LTDFILDGRVAKAKLKPGTYRLFTDGNEDMPWGGAVDGTAFTVTEPSAASGGGTGEKGDKGDTGATGPMGPAGPAGPKGDQGDVGPQGIPGVNGGEVGAKGETGDKGPVGDQGPVGDKGLTGDKGPVGDKGPTGDAGTGGAGTTINVTGGSLPKPTTTADVQALLNAAAANDTFVMFDPTTKVDITTPLVMQCKGNAGQPWGILGNGAKLVWKGPAGGKLLTVKGTVADWGAFRSNRGLLIEKLFLDGQGNSGDLLTLEALYGDPGSIYKSVIRDVYCVYSGKNGITLRGAVFESFLDNVHAENCLGHGMETAHDTTDRGGGRGIISNINIIHPNFSRNKGAGLKCTYSTNLTFGSFVLNAQGGVVADEGLRYAVGNNGENTGEALFVVQHKGYGSHIRGNEVSSDGSTHHRQFEGGKWVSYGSPCLYILSNVVKDIVPGEDFGGNHCSYYGGASTNPMRVIK
jgi:hypothetical protein